jgi:phage gp45-like
MVGANGNLTVNTVNNPTFSTSVTTPSLTNSGALSINATSANLTLQTTTSGNVVVDGAGTLDVQDNATFAGTLGVTGATTLSGDLSANGNTTIG